MALFTDKQMQFVYNHKILSLILFTIAVLIVLAVLILIILAMVYGPAKVFDFASWF